MYIWHVSVLEMTSKRDKDIQLETHPFMTEPKKNDHVKLRLVDVLQICKHADKFMLGFQ